MSSGSTTKLLQIRPKPINKNASVHQQEQLTTHAHSNSVAVRSGSSYATTNGTSEETEVSPSRFQRYAKATSVCDPVNEYLFLTPEVKEETNFLQKVRMETLMQGRSQAAGMPLSSPPKRQPRRLAKQAVTAATTALSGGQYRRNNKNCDSHSVDSKNLPSDQWPLMVTPMTSTMATAQGTNETHSTPSKQITAFTTTTEPSCQ